MNTMNKIGLGLRKFGLGTKKVAVATKNGVVAAGAATKEAFKDLGAGLKGVKLPEPPLPYPGDVMRAKIVARKKRRSA